MVAADGTDITDGGSDFVDSCLGVDLGDAATLQGMGGRGGVSACQARLTSGGFNLSGWNHRIHSTTEGLSDDSPFLGFPGTDDSERDGDMMGPSERDSGHLSDGSSHRNTADGSSAAEHSKPGGPAADPELRLDDESDGGAAAGERCCSGPAAAFLSGHYLV